MMLNMENQRPGDLWKIGGRTVEVLAVLEDGSLSVRDAQTGEAFVLRVELSCP